MKCVHLTSGCDVTPSLDIALACMPVLFPVPYNSGMMFASF